MPKAQTHPITTYKVTVIGDCGKVHASFEEWQQCKLCEAIIARNIRLAK